RGGSPADGVSSGGRSMVAPPYPAPAVQASDNPSTHRGRAGDRRPRADAPSDLGTALNASGDCAQGGRAPRGGARPLRRALAIHRGAGVPDADRVAAAIARIG